MRKIIFALAATAFSACSVQQAFAADMARPVYKAPPPPAVVIYNWTGFYVGGNVGWGWADGDANLIMNGFNGTASASGNGFLGGVQAGYNWQSGVWVFGIETDFQGTAGKSDVAAFAGPNSWIGTAKGPWFGTIRGRIGVAQDRVLWYVTGGALYGENKFSGTVTGFGPFSSSEVGWTYTVGGGIEWAVADRWTAKVEYLYAGPPSDAPTIPNTSLIDGDAHSHIVRAGLNYRF